MYTKHKIFIALLYCINFTCVSQTSKDAGSWITLSLQHSLAKKITLVIDEELRIKENYQRINLFYTNIGLDYKINKNFKISPSYRFMQKKRLEGTYSFRHRLMLDATIKKKVFGKLTISERARYQAEVADYNTSKKGHLIEQYLRLKTDFKIELSPKVSPYYSVEFRYQIRDPKGLGPLYDKEFHRVRNVLGLEYKHSDTHSFNFYYLYQSEFDINTPESIYILGLGYTLTI